MEDYIFYRSFPEITEAQELSEVLKAANVAHLLRQNDQTAISFMNSHSGDRYLIMVKEGDIKKADEVLLASVKELDITGHPFNDMSVMELEDVLRNKDEWNIVEVEIAKRILKDKGLDVSESKIQKLEAEKIEELRKEKKGNIALYVVALLCCVPWALSWWVSGGWMFYFSGSLAVAISANYAFAKTRLVNGERVFTYNAQTRLIGKLIFLLIIVLYLISLVSWLM